MYKCWQYLPQKGHEEGRRVQVKALTTLWGMFVAVIIVIPIIVDHLEFLEIRFCIPGLCHP